MAVQYNNRLQGRTVMVLPASCPYSVVVTMGNCRLKIKFLDIPLSGGGGGSGHKCLVHKGEANYCDAPARQVSCKYRALPEACNPTRKSKSPPFPRSVGCIYEWLVY